MEPLKGYLLKAGAGPVMPNNTDSDNSLASLYLIAWKVRDPEGVFHKFPITRDDVANRVPLSLPNSVTVLSWTVEDSIPDILEAIFTCSAIYIRDEYTVMLSALFKALHESGGDAFGYHRIDVRTLQDKYPPVNPFKELQVQKVLWAKAPCIVVTGTPGIGKSLFLYYILALRLLAQKSTVLLYRKGRCLIFHECGVYSMTLDQLETVVGLLPMETWFLVDSNEDVGPAPHFLFKSCRTTPRLIVVATSPRSERMTFREDLQSPRLWMHPFKEKELYEAMGTQVRRWKEIQLRAFYEKFGPMAREAFVFAGIPDRYLRVIQEKLGPASSQNLRNGIGQVPYGYFETSLSHKVLVAYPTDDSDRTEFNVAIPTRKLADLTISRLLEEENKQEARAICTLFLLNQKTRAIAGHLLESFALRVFPDGGQWGMTKMDRTDAPPKNSHWKRNPAGEEHVLHIGHKGVFLQILQDDPDALASGTFVPVGYRYFKKDSPPPQEIGFYTPVAANQPTFGAVARVNDAAKPFVIFQMTCAKTHKLNSIGLNWLGQGKVDVIVVTSWDGGEDIEVPEQIADKVADVYRLVLFPRP
ncbi:uncharacterized protein FOMMEDRAFT_160497 [Fomitiporia mediterranea MF3/22]|uniref:uncharacterized protein n=1 Tax=Fomitiporia mediterranea (strain MF3/22) TaxID=694068 RepID=UPI00044088F5|nr:uncharacterized protein FOMMEDRAFT_160497 [Fomitiporia mediterranea MF3/22]EJC99444.1 hypothetical protein FOMMEDRAFT_160497 [Fomitiporia mediterranea MF3/22]